MHRYNDAIAALRQYIVRYPDNWGAHFFLAISYDATGQREQAKTEAAEVRRLNPRAAVPY
jgi:Flp pilus assembly protein TadD